MSKNELHSIKGKKIRRQYFTIPVVLHYVLMLALAYFFLVFYIMLGRFDFSDWLSDVWISVWVCFVFSLPWCILKKLNRHFFGRIVCVLTEEGIHYHKGIIHWDCIEKIEYVFDTSPKYKNDPQKRCRAVIHTNGRHIAILHAPLSIIRDVKKYKPKINVTLSDKRVLLSYIVIITLLLALCPFISWLLADAVGPTPVQFGVMIAITCLIFIICRHLFDIYSIEYRFWRIILKKRWLYNIASWFLVLSDLAVLLLIIIFPQWWLIVLGSAYCGIVGTLSLRNRKLNIPSYEFSYEVYIKNANHWENQIKKQKEKQSTKRNK